MKEQRYTVKLTESQIDNLIDWFQDDFIEIIKNDGIDNVGWICDMCEIYKELNRVKDRLRKK